LGNADDLHGMVNASTIFGAIMGACLFSFRAAQISAETGGATVSTWRRVSQIVLGCGVLVLAAIRVYRVSRAGEDAAPTVGLGIAWTLIGALIGGFVADRDRFQRLLRK
jgi:hypothetical protein